MTNVKQVIVMRTDLGMRKGKMIAQGGHASVNAVLDRLKRTEVSTPTGPVTLFHGQLSEDSDLRTWLNTGSAKICVRVNSFEELEHVIKKAAQKGLPLAPVVDEGRTEFGGQQTLTCCAIGPARSELIEEITGELVLL